MMISNKMNEKEEYICRVVAQCYEHSPHKSALKPRTIRSFLREKHPKVGKELSLVCSVPVSDPAEFVIRCIQDVHMKEDSELYRHIHFRACVVKNLHQTKRTKIRRAESLCTHITETTEANKRFEKM